MIITSSHVTVSISKIVKHVVSYIIFASNARNARLQRKHKRLDAIAPRHQPHVQ